MEQAGTDVNFFFFFFYAREAGEMYDRVACQDVTYP